MTVITETERTSDTVISGKAGERGSSAAVFSMGVMAVISSLVGAGTSFSPLYVDIWGGMMLHPNCPAMGSRPAQTGENGLCVTAPSWFLYVALCCTCCAALFAIAFTHTVERLSRWSQRGNSVGGHGHRFHYADAVNSVCVVLSCVAVTALVVVSGQLGLVAWVVVWWLMAFVASRVMELMGPVVRAWVPALLIGFGSVLFTQLSLVGSITVSGGFIGAIMCSAATFALQRMRSWCNDRETSENASVVMPVSDWKDHIPKGMISQFFVVLVAYLSCAQYSTLRMSRMKLCPAFSANSGGGLIASCTDQHVMSMVIGIVLAGLSLSALAAAASAFTAVLRLRRLAQSLMVMSSACACLVFVISFSIA
ncbi:hypothetical protein [Bifidobacterium aquikefiri]|uniref:hypothetical protein n=1 Tax=Bifidobacterium aquikefiri TaxID=1653207 RepID=UPI0039E9D676